MIVHLTRQGAQARLRRGRLFVEYQDETLAFLPLHVIQRVVVWGNVSLTTPLLTTLAKHGIAVVFLTRRGEFRAGLYGPETPHVVLRRAQYTLTTREEWLLGLGRAFVAAKLHHQRVLLLRRRRRRSDVPEVSYALQRLEDALRELPQMTSLQAVRGLEGRSARAYFKALRALLRPECGLQGRTRRPPRDPANALLSLGYTLLTRRAESALLAVGLDPFVGFLHTMVYGRPALALDLAEEFRPVVDGLMLALCNARRLTPEDFQPAPRGGWQLRESSLPVFLRAFEARWARPVRPSGYEVRRPLGHWLVAQARQLARRIATREIGFEGLRFR